MCRKSYLVISGVVFGVVAIGHLARLAYHLPVQIGEWNAPMWPSWPGVVGGPSSEHLGIQPSL